MTSGVQVRHFEFGKGVVLEALSRGGVRCARVDFGYMTDWVLEADLEQAGGPRVQPSECESSVTEGTEGSLARRISLSRLTEDIVSARRAALLQRIWALPVPGLTEDIVSARRAVLALKLGQVLQENVLDLSVATEGAEAVLKSAVDSAATRQKPAAILVRGPYGAGKTHLLAMLAALAAHKGLATASAILDGEGVTLAQPMTILEPVLQSLCFPDESAPSGVGRRFAEWCPPDHISYINACLSDLDDGIINDDHRWSRITAARRNMPKAAMDDPDVVEVLEDYLTTSLTAPQASRRLRDLTGEQVHLPAMKAHKIVDRAGRFCELLADWAFFCTEVGAKGLVVIFDEVDVEYASTLWDVDCRTRRQHLLSELNRLLGESVPLVIAFGSAPATDVDAADDAARDLEKRMPRIRSVDAPRPGSNQIRALGRRLCELYTGAYPDWISDVDQRSIERAIDEHAERYEEALDPAPRRFVRELLEWLDVAPKLDGTRISKAR